MKFTPFITFLLVFAFAYSLSSCGDDDDNTNSVICGDNFNLNVVLEAELRDLTLAAQAYAQDQTEANCNSYKASLNAYIDAAADYRVCAVQIGQQASFDQSIENVRTDIDALVCQ